MVLAIAALFFQFAPSVQALPIAAAAVKSSVPEPAIAALNLPASPADADVNLKTVAKAAASGSNLDAKSESDGSSSAEPGSILTTSMEIAAQNTQALSNIRLSDSLSARETDLIAVQRLPSHR